MIEKANPRLVTERFEAGKEPECPVCGSGLLFDEYVDAIDYHDATVSGFSCENCGADLTITGHVVRTFTVKARPKQ